MMIYDKLKQLYEIVKGKGDVDTMQIILDLHREMLEWEKEMIILKDENKSLKESEIISDRIIRHKQLFLTIQDNNTGVLYCAHCWDSDSNEKENN